MTRWVQIVGLRDIRAPFAAVWCDLDASGLNVWHGTVMSSSARWLTIGVVLDVVAILLLVRAGLLLRRRPVQR